MTKKTNAKRVDSVKQDNLPDDIAKVGHFNERSVDTEFCGSGELAHRLRTFETNIKSKYRYELKLQEVDDYLDRDQIAQNIIEFPVYDGLSNWRDIKNPTLRSVDDDLSSAIYFQKAWETSRKIGVSYIYPIILNESNEEFDTKTPIDDIENGKVVRFIIISAKPETDDYFTDLTSIWYGYHRYYIYKGIDGDERKIHASRLIHVGNGKSLFFGICGYLADYHESRMRKFKSKRRNAGIVAKANMQEIIQAMAMKGKTSVEAITDYARTIDDNINDSQVVIVPEKAELLPFNQNNIDQLVTSQSQEEVTLCAAGSVPYSKLFGKPTGGISSTSVDVQNYVQATDTKRAKEVEPALLQHDYILSKVGGFETTREDWKWNKMQMIAELESESQQIENTDGDDTGSN